MYAAVLYIKNLRTNEVNFLIGKNRVVNKQLESKTIPTLELQSITLGVQLLMDTFSELSGPNAVIPINVQSMQLFTDSLISLHWINGHQHKLEKLNKLSVFVMNRLNFLVEQCSKFPVVFSYIETKQNPSDCLTRCLSHKLLMKSPYINGPPFLRETIGPTLLDVIVPNPSSKLTSDGPDAVVESNASVVDIPEHFIPLDRYSELRTLVRVFMMVRRCVSKFKEKLSRRSVSDTESDCSYRSAYYSIIENDQRINFPDIYAYLSNAKQSINECPPLVERLNLFLDGGLLKVKSKFDRWQDDPNFSTPILLSKDSPLTGLIIRNVHEKNGPLWLLRSSDVLTEVVLDPSLL